MISPLLANVYLNILEKAVNSKNGVYKRKGVRIVRYADDFILMGKSNPDSIIDYTVVFTFRYDGDKQGITNYIRCLRRKANVRAAFIIKQGRLPLL